MTLNQATASTTVEVTVVVSTLNRTAEVERAVRSLLAQHGVQSTLEVIVVDNGSSDECARTISALPLSPIQVRYLREPRLGLSYARNAGIDHARGSIVAFLDDDAEADSGWVVHLLNVFRADNTVGAAGGRTVVRWPAERPLWISSTVEGYYGLCDYGASRRVLRFPEYPFGSNMAFRRSVLNELGGFRVDLGARGNNLMAGEETDLFERLHSRGVAVVYDPFALVHHWVSPDRVSRRWSLRRAFQHGVSSTTISFHGDSTRRYWTARSVLALCRSSVAAVATAIAGVSAASPSTTMSRAATSVYWAGVVRGSLANMMKRRDRDASHSDT
jgi:glucosyl-dolichyl phosphate glucuronosyltransferase